MEEEKKQNPIQRYPYYSLKQCVEYLEKLYSTDRLAEVPKDTAMVHMGLDPKNDFSARATASLNGFALVEEKGTAKNRTLRISQLGRAVVLTKDNTRSDALKKAALSYEIIKALYEKWWEGLPSDEVIKLEVVNRGFSERAAGRFVPVFRETYDFAQLGNATIPAGDKEIEKDGGSKKSDNGEGGDVLAAKIKSLRESGYEEYTLTLSSKKEIKLYTSDTLTNDDIEFMLLWIKRLDLARKDENNEQG